MLPPELSASMGASVESLGSVTGSNCSTKDWNDAARLRNCDRSLSSLAWRAAVAASRSARVASRASISSILRERSAASSAAAVRFASLRINWQFSSASATVWTARSSEERSRSLAAASASATVLAARSCAESVIDFASARASEIAVSAVRCASTRVRSSISRVSLSPSPLPVWGSV